MNESLDRKVAVAVWIAVLLITVAAGHLHWLFLHHAGGLWRDEASIVRIATLPTLSEMWRMIKYESFPPLMHFIIRAWTAVGLGESDLYLRWLGFTIGLAWFGSLWCAARLMRNGVPVVSLALLALNVTVIRAGDSLRAYGLGSALIVLLLALMWQFTRKPTLGNGLLTTFAAVLSVQCLYQNAFFVLAACCGACVLCILRRQRQRALCIVGIGTAAAISLAPYVSTIIWSQEWFMLTKVGFMPVRIWEQASIAMGFPLAWFNLVWVLLFLLGIGRAGSVIWHGTKAALLPASRDLVIFAGIALIFGLVAFIFFLKVASLPTQPWHYLPLMAFVGVCLDAILVEGRPWVRATLVAFATLTALVVYPPGLSAVQGRQTNVDILAAHLTREAATNDLIIVHPWYCGITFQRYYHGETPWTTLPPLEDHGLHRYDLLKVQMQLEDPIRPVLDRVASTLQSGNHVWLVGWIPLDGSPTPELRPAPNNSWGWFDEPYSEIWAAQAGNFIVTHASRGGLVMSPSTNCANSFENLPVILVAGWRNEARTNAP